MGIASVAKRVAMRVAALVLAVIIGLAPSASAQADAALSIDGPSFVDASEPVRVDLIARLALRGVVCAGEAEVVVHLGLPRASGLARVSIEPERIVFRVPAKAALEGWQGRGEASLSIDAREQEALVDVRATYSLPAHCRIAEGGRPSQALHTITIQGPSPPPAPRASAHVAEDAPSAAPRTESILDTRSNESSLRPIALKDPPLPGALVAAMMGTLVGGVLVAIKRIRARGG